MSIEKIPYLRNNAANEFNARKDFASTDAHVCTCPSTMSTAVPDLGKKPGISAGCAETITSALERHEPTVYEYHHIGHWQIPGRQLRESYIRVGEGTGRLEEPLTARDVISPWCRTTMRAKPLIARSSRTNSWYRRIIKTPGTLQARIYNNCEFGEFENTSTPIRHLLPRQPSGGNRNVIHLGKPRLGPFRPSTRTTCRVGIRDRESRDRGIEGSRIGPVVDHTDECLGTFFCVHPPFFSLSERAHARLRNLPPGRGVDDALAVTFIYCN